MAFKMKGTAMYDKTMVDGKSMMKLKKEFGGAMEMKSPMDAAKPDYIDIDGDGNKKESMKEAAAAMPMKSPMDLSPKKLTQDAAMKLTSEIKKSGMPLKEEDDSPMEMGLMGVGANVVKNAVASGEGVKSNPRNSGSSKSARRSKIKSRIKSKVSKVRSKIRSKVSKIRSKVRR